MQNSATTCEFSVLDAFFEKDGRRSRYIGEVLERYRGADIRDLKRSELNESWTCLNVLKNKICKLNPKILMDEKSWGTRKSILKVVMDEELVEKIVLDEKFVKNFVMDVNVDPKNEMNLTTLKISGWNILQHSKRKLLEESVNVK